MNKVFLTALNASVTASWLVLAIFIVKKLFKNAPSWLIMSLWAFVAIRLVIPFSVESPVSLVPSSETFEMNLLDNGDYYINTGLDVIDEPLNEYMGERYYEGVTVRYNFKNDLISVLWKIWLMGTAAMILHAAYSYIRIKSMLSAATKYKGNIYQSEFVYSPFVLGVFSPKIYIPYDMKEETAAIVISHEQTHIKHSDHLIKLFAYVILCVYWFNPVLHLAYSSFCRDLEIRCDEKVTGNYDIEGRKKYASALLEASARKNSFRTGPLSFGETGIKERIKGIMKYKKPTKTALILSFVLIIFFAVFLMTNPPSAGIEDIDVWTENIFDSAERVYAVTPTGEYLLTDSISIENALDALKEIKINKHEISKSRDEDRPRDNIIDLGDVTLCFNEGCTQVWLDDGVKPSYTYRIKNPQYVTQTFFDGYFKGSAVTNRLKGEIITMFSNPDEPLRYEIRNSLGEYLGIIVPGDTTVLFEHEDDRLLISELTGGIILDGIYPGAYISVSPVDADPSAPGAQMIGESYEWLDAKEYYIAREITVTGFDKNYFLAEGVAAKPVIYLYPEETTQVEVKLDYNGTLTTVYPAYDGLWRVTAYPDGTLTDEDGMEYNYLYWEGASGVEYDFSEGFCVKGSDSAEFLENILAQLGLTRREANEFIVYWLPKMQMNEYNIVSFQSDRYCDNAVLTVNPKPDTVIRVFMAIKPSGTYEEIPPQEIVFTEREGFTLVEWGGCVVE